MVKHFIQFFKERNKINGCATVKSPSIQEPLAIDIYIMINCTGCRVRQFWISTLNQSVYIAMSPLASQLCLAMKALNNYLLKKQEHTSTPYTVQKTFNLANVTIFKATCYTSFRGKVLGKRVSSVQFSYLSRCD